MKGIPQLGAPVRAITFALLSLRLKPEAQPSYTTSPPVGILSYAQARMV
jgi:hypothetical protein